MHLKVSVTMFCLLFLIKVNSQNQILKTNTGTVKFVSNAPLEIIKAKSTKLQGVINLSTKTFSFKIGMLTFKGFNNPLQKEHFFENYMETEKFSEALFIGKIVEPTLENGTQLIRAKGMLTIHGVSNEVILEVDIINLDNSVKFKSNFKINLEDYNINIPTIVDKKISQEIEVSVEGKLTP